MTKVFIIPSGFTVIGLALLSKMTSTRFFADKSVPDKQLGEFEEIGHPPSFFEGLIDLFFFVPRARSLSWGLHFALAKGR